MLSDYPELIKEIDFKLNPTLNVKNIKTLTRASNFEVKWKCSKVKCDHHVWACPISSRTKTKTSTGCPFCSQNKNRWCECDSLANKFPELVKEWHPKNKKSPKDYCYTSSEKVWWIREDNYEWETKINTRTVRNYISLESEGEYHDINVNVDSSYNINKLKNICKQLDLIYSNYWIKQKFIDSINNKLIIERSKKQENKIVEYHTKDEIKDNNTKDEIKDDIIKTNNKNKMVEDMIETNISKNEIIEDIIETNTSKIINNENIIKMSLIIDNGEELMIPVRYDGYINLTKLFKAYGKLFNDWNRLIDTKALVKALEGSRGYPLDPNTRLPLPSIIKIKTGPNIERGTWAHRKLAINAARWCSVSAELQIINWVDELLLTGKVELGNEKSSEELDKIWKDKYQQILLQNNQLQIESGQKDEKIQEQITTIKKLKQAKNRLEKTHKYIKFDPKKNKGHAWYLFSYGRICSDNCRTKGLRKHGIHGYDKKDDKKDDKEEKKDKVSYEKSLDSRLETHRTTFPLFVLEAVIFTKDANKLEELLERKLGKNLNPSTHEVFELDYDKIIETAIICLNFMESEYTIVPKEEIEQYNEDINDTLKDKNIEILEDIDDEIIEEEIDNILKEENIEEKPRVIIINKYSGPVTINISELSDIKSSLNNLTLVKLKEVLDKLNISKAGNKNKLIERLNEFLMNNNI
jgi:hypothetical protein